MSQWQNQPTTFTPISATASRTFLYKHSLFTPGSLVLFFSFSFTYLFPILFPSLTYRVRCQSSPDDHRPGGRRVYVPSKDLRKLHLEGRRLDQRIYIPYLRWLEKLSLLFYDELTNKDFEAAVRPSMESGTLRELDVRPQRG
ncbi:hypothetical protein F4820DRAFT_57532 [Hypoxylon rubiginosum]|uniref:Uncharacterized protein n=1 Tax=Hypoxylon rubiginosum TaxID=110542 RepID=A0ACB9YQF6_9PEZI|nr:hypothetical protein F4820DRAFT_57532 [Hypoxylon rubiginosum]